MIILGITPIQAKIMKMIKHGHDYKGISISMGITEQEAATQEMLAMAALADRWNKKESEVKTMIRTMLLLILCLIPTLQNDGIERAPRTSTAKTTKSGRKEGSPLDLLTYDV